MHTLPQLVSLLRSWLWKSAVACSTLPTPLSLLPSDAASVGFVLRGFTTRRWPCNHKSSPCESNLCAESSFSNSTIANKPYTANTVSRISSSINNWHTHQYKVKPTWILLEQETVSGSSISWAVCKSVPRSRQITTLAPHCSVTFYRPDALPAAQRPVSKHWGYISEEITKTEPHLGTTDVNR